jgi:hypothetical protein
MTLWRRGRFLSWFGVEAPPAAALAAAAVAGLAAAFGETAPRLNIRFCMVSLVSERRIGERRPIAAAAAGCPCAIAAPAP